MQRYSLTTRDLFAIAGLGCSLFCGGCGSMAGDGGLSAAQVRFIEVSPGSPELDFYVNGTGAAYGVGYESFTSYLPVSPGPVNLTVHRAGGGRAIASAQENLSAGRQYTAVVTHGLASLEERLYQDQDTPAPAGQIALRVIHEVDSVGALTVYLAPSGSGASPVALTVGRGAATQYVNLPATGSYVITATTPENGVNLPIASATVRSESGAVRTVVFAGLPDSTGRKGVVGFSVTDVDPSQD